MPYMSFKAIQTPDRKDDTHWLTSWVIFSLLTIFLLYVAAVGIYHFENPAQPEVFKDIFHSMWWSVATLTTVGYGDMYPITDGGKFFSSMIIFISLGID